MRGDLSRAERTPHARQWLPRRPRVDDEPCSRRSPDPVLGDVHSAQGDHELAANSSTRRPSHCEPAFGDPLLVMDAIYTLGDGGLPGEKTRSALTRHSRTRSDRPETSPEAPYVAAAQLMLALIELEARDISSAVAHVRQEGRFSCFYSSLGDDRSRARCLVALAGVAVEDGFARSGRSSPRRGRRAARGLGGSRRVRPADPRGGAAPRSIDWGAESVERLSQQRREACPIPAPWSGRL